MILLNVDKSLSEVKPMLISGCLRLLGKDIEPSVIEDCLVRDKFGSLSLNDVSDLINYSRVVDFLQCCKEQNFNIMTSTLAITLCNFILRKISLSKSFVRSDMSLDQLQLELDKVFQKAHAASSVENALKVLVNELPLTKFIVSDLEAFIFVLVNFFLYNYGGSVIIFDEIEDVSSSFDYFVEFVNFM